MGERRHFNRKHGMKKRLKIRDNSDASGPPRKIAPKVDTISDNTDSPSSTSAGKCHYANTLIRDLLDKQLSGASSEEEVVPKEPSIYNNLLRTLGSGSDQLANAYAKRRREEEGKSDSEEEDTDDGKEALSPSEEDDVDEKVNNEAGINHPMGSKLEDSYAAGSVEHSEDGEFGDDDEASDVDRQIEVTADQSNQVSSFSAHLGHQLSKEDVDNLMQSRWKYKWEEPAPDMLNWKWRGTGEPFLKEGVDIHNDCGLRRKLSNHWLQVYMTSGGTEFHLSKQRNFFYLCSSYRDILHSNKKPFYVKGGEEDSSIMDAYTVHAMNHIFKTRDLVMKNDAKMAKHQETAKEQDLAVESFLDQGFTRPKILVLLPLASIALRFVRRLIQLTPPSHKVNVEHIDRFSDTFGAGGAEDDSDSDELNNGGNHGSLKSRKSSKPTDFQVLFGGNNDDHFMMGIKFTRRSIKLFSDFYSSDMIVASPLGLITKIGESELGKEKDVDYLSSIEILIIDHADVISMQNWSHVNAVVEKLNCIPSKQHGTDVMRVRQWYLDGHAKFYRQTIILGSYLNPDTRADSCLPNIEQSTLTVSKMMKLMALKDYINAFFNHNCANYQGKVKLVCEYKGILSKVLLPVRQIYERFDAASLEDADDIRLEYFSKKVFPRIKDTIQGGVMLFVSSYFEFVRVRNFLKSQNASFCLLGEYTKQSDISRARVWFFEGRRKIMLYTERAHFYHRYKPMITSERSDKSVPSVAMSLLLIDVPLFQCCTSCLASIRGIQNLIIYSLPERKEFYPEIVNMLEGSNNMTCTVLFSRIDQFKLERIVGTAPAKRMVSSEKSMFVFCE
ncbi:U3 small nucleolar RNA-associated protein 25 [Dillenia turbinata]|uniref:U3 small nucleolar RNA-associated protein 25 n=1 Tax=Dillenia turbinata TaxID=194707 RepID=A0AAN8UXF8_9MAGN